MTLIDSLEFRELLSEDHRQHDCESWRSLIAHINAKITEAVNGKWIPVDPSTLPVGGQPVLVLCDKRVLRAAHVGKFELSEENWGLWRDGEGADYNEADDTTYWPEGWCEWNEHEEIHWQLKSAPSHWMPLPTAIREAS